MSEVYGYCQLRVVDVEESRADTLGLALCDPEDTRIWYRKGNLIHTEGIEMVKGEIDLGELYTIPDLAQSVAGLLRGRAEIYAPNVLSNFFASVVAGSVRSESEYFAVTSDLELIGLRVFCAQDRLELNAGVVVKVTNEWIPLCESHLTDGSPEFPTYAFKKEDGDIMFRYK